MAKRTVRIVHEASDTLLAEGPVGWVLPNPLLPFIWFRIAVPANDPALSIEIREAPDEPPALSPPA